jgi:hypothetical protein
MRWFTTFITLLTLTGCSDLPNGVVHSCPEGSVQYDYTYRDISSDVRVVRAYCSVNDKMLVGNLRDYDAETGIIMMEQAYEDGEPVGDKVIYSDRLFEASWNGRQCGGTRVRVRAPSGRVIRFANDCPDNHEPSFPCFGEVIE